VRRARVRRVETPAERGALAGRRTSPAHQRGRRSQHRSPSRLLQGERREPPLRDREEAGAPSASRSSSTQRAMSPLVSAPMRWSPASGRPMFRPGLARASEDGAYAVSRGRRPGPEAVVGGSHGSEPRAEVVRLSALRPVSPRDQRAHAAHARGRREPPSPRAHRVRSPGTAGRRTAEPRRVAIGRPRADAAQATSLRPALSSRGRAAEPNPANSTTPCMVFRAARGLHKGVEMRRRPRTTGRTASSGSRTWAASPSRARPSTARPSAFRAPTR
jgi:hypothetical protein